MSPDRFLQTIDELHERLLTLTKTKGEEYKQREDNQFSNFDWLAKTLSLTREQVLVVYLTKHLNSINTWVSDCARGENRSYSEPVFGRIDDAILYLLLLRGMAEEKHQLDAKKRRLEGTSWAPPEGKPDE